MGGGSSSTADVHGRMAVDKGSVSWRLDRSASPRALLILAHGAGAPMIHPTMNALTGAFVAVGLDVFRFNFPFMEIGRRRTDAKPIALDAFAAAAEQARAVSAAETLLIGGHSFGGRMASHAVLERDLGAVRALLFCSFPLHPANKPSVQRAEHLPRITQPMLFLSGTRDALASRDLLESVVGGLPNATLDWLDTADHGYKVLKRARARTDTVFEEIAEATDQFVTRVASM